MLAEAFEPSIASTVSAMQMLNSANLIADILRQTVSFPLVKLEERFCAVDTASSVTKLSALSIAPQIEELTFAVSVPQLELGQLRTVKSFPESTSTDFITSPSRETSTRESFNGSAGGEAVWGYSDWLKVYYNIASHYLDLALEEPGVHDLSARQRVGICLTGAIALSAHPNGLTAPDSAVVMMFIYTALTDLSE